VAHHGAQTESIDMGGHDVNHSGSSLLAPIPNDSSRELTNLGHGGLNARLPAATFYLILVPAGFLPLLHSL
jgi:hypothetical protein